MRAIQLELIPHTTQLGLAYNHLHIQITTDNGIITPSDIKGLKLPPGIDFTKGVVIEGKAPIWLYGYLVHECHPAAWVGCYDTRLGAVVVATHTHDVAIGEVFQLTLPTAVI
ncbi:MAG: CRISPR-associated ring nuclease Crn3/Csx3 [Scytonema sp. PMC 1069.18]|nr:CRISPR-associated ring nuclease Crn3/Csx3 [Scytonema sp. PMC 1069.18]MEC4884248.1 CRISPR-associated ring nuclease Crn3/Csx3 [Scytonema sp. PMC 1070.18]